MRLHVLFPDITGPFPYSHWSGKARVPCVPNLETELVPSTWQDLKSLGAVPLGYVSVEMGLINLNKKTQPNCG